MAKFKSERHPDFSSFAITLPREQADTLLNPELWIDGTHYKIFTGTAYTERVVEIAHNVQTPIESPDPLDPEVQTETSPNGGMGELPTTDREGQ